MTLNDIELYETSKQLYLNDPNNEEHIRDLTNLQNKRNEFNNLKEIIQMNKYFNNLILLDYLELFYNLKYDDIVNVYYYDADMNKFYNFSHTDIARSFVDNFRVKFNNFDYIIFTLNDNNKNLYFKTILL